MDELVSFITPRASLQIASSSPQRWPMAFRRCANDGLGVYTMKTLIIAPGPYINAFFGAAELTPQSEEFRAHAAECQKMAACWSGLIKEQYEALARQWLVVADQVEGKRLVATSSSAGRR
jgi:hypothetical protein